MTTPEETAEDLMNRLTVYRAVKEWSFALKVQLELRREETFWRGATRRPLPAPDPQLRIPA